MKPASAFSEVLGRYVRRSAYTPGQLSRLTGLPKGTIVNWLEGRVRKPRVREDLLRMAEALHLDPVETAEMLGAAGHAIPATLEDGNPLNGDTAPSNGLPHRAPFQAIPDLPYFVGREETLNALERQLRNGHTVTIHSLHGMGGVGKTTLAAHLAYRLRPHFPDGILWARLDLSDPMAVLGTFARAYGHDVTPFTDLDSRSRVVRDLLADKRVLIVLDNVEESESVRPLLPPTGGCAVILTTRRQDLAVAMGAHRTVLGPFDASGSEALMLFSKFLGEERVAREERELVELAERLGHLPLAVAIAAGRLAYEPDWTARDFLARLKQSRDLHVLDYGEQSVRATFDLSFTLLPERVQEFFALLALFRGSSFTVEAASRIMGVGEGQAHDWMRQLFRLSLVQGSKERRYRLHPLLQSYARTLLASGREKAVWERRLVEYYAGFATTHRQERALLREEQENILGACEIAIARGMQELLCSLVEPFHAFLEHEGQAGSALHLLDSTVTSCRAAGDLETLERMLAHVGRIALNHREVERARAALSEGLTLARASGDETRGLHFLPGLAMAERIAGDYDRAEAYLEEALPIAQRAEDEPALAAIQGVLGEVMLERGDFDRAEQLLSESLELYRALGMTWMVRVQSHNLGITVLLKGEEARAERYLLQSLEMRADFQLRSLTLEAMGELRTMQGRFDEAEAYLEEALEVATRFEQRWVVAAILAGWGEWHLAQARYDEAHAAFDNALAIAREMSLPLQEAEALYGMGRVAGARGAHLDALRYGHQSLLLLDQLHHYRAGDVRAFVAGQDG